MPLIVQTARGRGQSAIGDLADHCIRCITPELLVHQVHILDVELADERVGIRIEALASSLERGRVREPRERVLVGLPELLPDARVDDLRHPAPERGRFT